MKILKATECFKMIESNKAIHCVDVREPYEYEFGNCGFQNIPMETLRHQAEQMDKSIEIMLLCRSGKRAEAIGNLLEVEHGFEHVIIVENGMQGWKEEVDTTLSIY